MAAAGSKSAVSQAQSRCAWQRACRTAIMSGSAASVCSAIALAIGGAREEGTAAGPLNGPSQWVWGSREARTTETTLRHTLLGYSIHHLSSLFWATLHERIFPPHESPQHAMRSAAQATVTAAFAYIVDYHVAPRRLRPGFRKHIGPASIFASYAAFAAGLALVRIGLRAAKR
jgi:hypothetical protein